MDMGVQGLLQQACVQGVRKLIEDVLACLLGCGEVGLWLSAIPNSWVILGRNPHKAWMDEYCGEHYHAVKFGFLEQLLNEFVDTIEVIHAAHFPSQVQGDGVWEVYEVGWDMAVDLKPYDTKLGGQTYLSVTLRLGTSRKPSQYF